ncbi:hypothetical protein [Aquimarina addita]
MLEKLSKEFPYFQPIKALLLKGLKDQESFRYNQELKTTAAYTADRSVLFDFITSPVFDKSTDQYTHEKKNKNDIEVIGAEEINVLERMSMEDAIAMKIKEAEDVLNPGLFHTKEKNETPRNITIAETIIEQAEKNHPEAIKVTDTENDPAIVLQIDKPLNFDKKERHSFKEWLQLSNIQPIDRIAKKETPTPTTSSSIESLKEENELPSEKEHKFDLISKFIKENPKIKPADKSTSSRNLAKEHAVAPDELMTETLARVYLTQKKYKNAIQAYKILILKNPEKSGFFADQIRAIKKLQENKH